MTKVLPALRTAFRWLNVFTVRAIDAGFGPRLGNPLTGSMLVLRTVGHRSGLPRRAPLGYALLEGRVIVVAGYGRATHWFRNALAHPDVELALPGAVLSGRAQEITDDAERRRAFRAVVLAEGVVGRLTVGDVAAASDARVDELVAGLPVLAITVTGVRPGPFDPGGRYWRYALAEGVLAGAGAVVLYRRGLRRGGSGREKRGFRRCCAGTPPG